MQITYELATTVIPHLLQMIAFGSQPVCPSAFTTAVKVSTRFSNQSPAMKNLRDLGDKGGNKNLVVDNADILVKSKAMPRRIPADSADTSPDYLPGEMKKSYTAMKKCNGKCIYGRDMIFKAVANQAFESVFYPKTSCPW